jgi:hypothetical protein
MQVRSYTAVKSENPKHVDVTVGYPVRVDTLAKRYKSDAHRHQDPLAIAGMLLSALRALQLILDRYTNNSLVITSASDTKQLSHNHTL